MRRDLKKGDLEYELFNDYWQICNTTSQKLQTNIGYHL